MKVDITLNDLKNLLATARRAEKPVLILVRKRRHGKLIVGLRRCCNG
jgi:hypothetical protein